MTAPRVLNGSADCFSSTVYVYAYVMFDMYLTSMTYQIWKKNIFSQCQYAICLVVGLMSSHAEYSTLCQYIVPLSSFFVETVYLILRVGNKCKGCLS